MKNTYAIMWDNDTDKYRTCNEESEDYEEYTKNTVKGNYGYTLEFDGKDYNRLWGRDVDGDSIAEALASIMCDGLNKAESKEFKFVTDTTSDDVRYAVYWSQEEKKFISVCIQDFDIPDYIEDNFVCGPSGELWFYRSDFRNNAKIDSDDLAKEMCNKVCELLNQSNIIGA